MDDDELEAENQNDWYRRRGLSMIHPMKKGKRRMFTGAGQVCARLTVKLGRAMGIPRSPSLRLVEAS